MTAIDTPLEDDDGSTAASLTHLVLSEEANRLATQEAGQAQTVYADDELPGVGDAEMSVREAVAVGGSGLLVVLSVLNAFDDLDAAAAGLLAPDVQDTLGVSDAVITIATTAGSLLLIVGSLVIGRFADKGNRARIVGLLTIAWSTIVCLTAFVANALQYFLARALTGFGKSNTFVVQGPMLADGYPIAARARVFGLHGVVGRAGGLLAPLVVGGIVVLAGGDEGWRWAYGLIGIPTLIIGIFMLSQKDPPRGQFEQLSTVGEVVDKGEGPPIAMNAAYQRLMQIRTYRSALFAFIAVGFTFITVPILTNLYLEDEFDLSAFERALVTTVPGIVALVVIPLTAKQFDRVYRESPPRALVVIGCLFIPTAIFLPIQMAMPNALLFSLVGIVNVVATTAAYTMIGPLMTAVNPYYLRSQGAAVGIGLIFGIGGVGGAVIGGLLSDAVGTRFAIIAVGVPANLLGAFFLINGSRFIRNDLSITVEEIREAEDEKRRLEADPDNVPVLQLRNIDFSYGTVQVLFGVDLDVRRGETLALLGTNGAGKSTVLRVISGLGIPSRGMVRLNGHSVTLCSAETRVRWGIHQLPGGKAVFPPMSVGENLEMAGYAYRKSSTERQERLERSLEIFPELRDRMGDRAGDLSGGQQQMLGLAMVLMHDPEVILIDELSLGLAPVVVEQLLGVVDRLKAAGQTMIIVEQSLNVALSIADRAVFMEKGRIRFEGPARELLERDDLARAVFLGSGQA